MSANAAVADLDLERSPNGGLPHHQLCGDTLKPPQVFVNGQAWTICIQVYSWLHIQSFDMERPTYTDRQVSGLGDLKMLRKKTTSNGRSNQIA